MSATADARLELYRSDANTVSLDASRLADAPRRNVIATTNECTATFPGLRTTCGPHRGGRFAGRSIPLRQRITTARESCQVGSSLARLALHWAQREVLLANRRADFATRPEPKNNQGPVARALIVE